MASPNRYRRRVLVLDLLAIAPYYDSYLVRALEPVTDVELSAIDPFHDRTLFRDLRRPRFLINRTTRLTLRNTRLRRATASIEYIANLIVHLIALWLAPPAVLHIQWLPFLQYTPFSFELCWLRLVRVRGVPIVLTVHNITPHERPGDIGRFRRVYAHCDALICHTDEAKRALVTHSSVHPDRVHVIPHGPLLYDKIGDVAPSGTLLVAAIGSIRRYKGLDVLLRAWPRVTAAVPDARLVVAGDGPADVVRELRAVVPHGARLVARPLSTNEVVALHREAAVIVLPYRGITQSGALLTAMAFEKPIVLSALPAFEATLPQYPADLFVPPEDDERLANALIALLRSDERRRLAAELVRAAVPSWQDIAKATNAVYAKVSSQASGARGNEQSSR